MFKSSQKNTTVYQIRDLLLDVLAARNNLIDDAITDTQVGLKPNRGYI